MIIKLENHVFEKALFGTIWNNSYNQAHVVLSQLVVSCQEGALHCLRIISFKFHKVPYSIPPEEDPSVTEKIYQCKTAQLIITVTT